MKQHIYILMKAAILHLCLMKLSTFEFNIPLLNCNAWSHARETHAHPLSHSLLHIHTLVYVHWRMHTHVVTHTHACTQSRICTRTGIYTLTCEYIFMHMSTQPHIFRCGHTHCCILTHAYSCSHMHAQPLLHARSCMHTCAQTLMHRHWYTDTRAADQPRRLANAHLRTHTRAHSLVQADSACNPTNALSCTHTCACTLVLKEA